MEVTEEMEERMWGLLWGGPEDPWPYCLYYGLCDLGQVISPLCASVSSTVNGDL